MANGNVVGNNNLIKSEEYQSNVTPEMNKKENLHCAGLKNLIEMVR